MLHQRKGQVIPVHLGFRMLRLFSQSPPIREIMRTKDELESTSNMGVYNKLIKMWRAATGKINCAWCAYHRSENKKDWRKHPRKRDRKKWNS